MSDPTRLLDAPGLLGDERELLRSGLDVDPPADAQAAVWASLSAALPLAAAGAAGAAGASVAAGAAGGSTAASAAVGGAKALGLFGALKVGLAVLALGGAGLVGYHFARPQVDARVATTESAPSDAVAAPTAVAARPIAPIEPVAVATAEATSAPVIAPEAIVPAKAPTVARAAAPAAAAPAERKPASDGAAAAAPEPSAVPAEVTPAEERATLAKQDTGLVREARAALRSGNAAAALQLVAESHARFPHSINWEERELITIEALYKSGQRAQASQRAQAYLRTHPSSVYADRLRAFIE